MRIADVGLIAGDTVRSRAYVQALAQTGLLPNSAIVMANPAERPLPGQAGKTRLSSQRKSLEQIRQALGLGFDPGKALPVSLEEAGVPYQSLHNTDINSEEVVSAVSEASEKIMIYSGFGGVILRKKILGLGKLFLHVHGGYLPDYKGSTANYYSLIAEEKCGASAIFLDEKIDSGPLLMRRWFDPPSDLETLDYLYDSLCRAKVLVECVSHYAEQGKWPEEETPNRAGETYYIIHPLLRHIVVSGRCANLFSPA